MTRYFGPACTPSDGAPTLGFVEYIPDAAATYAYLAIFALFLVLQTGLGIRYRTWYFWLGLFCGLVLEVIGYAGRIILRTSPCKLSNFLTYFIPMGLGPAFMTASIYLTLGHLINVFGAHYSRFVPRTYTCVFVSSDFIALAIQAVGGALTASAETDSQRQVGVNILITGLTLQAAGLLIFLCLAAEYGVRVRRGDAAMRHACFAGLRAKTSFKGFIWAVTVASVAIFIRCIYRVVELSDGFSGDLANDETTFLVLEGPMIMIAMLALTLYHPGVVFKSDWQASQFKWRRDKSATAEKNHKSSDASVEVSSETV